MRFEKMLTALRKGTVVYHGAYAHKLDAEKQEFYVDTPLSVDPWMKIEVDAEMLCCNNWNFVGGSDWRKYT